MAAWSSTIIEYVQVTQYTAHDIVLFHHQQSSRCRILTVPVVDKLACCPEFKDLGQADCMFHEEQDTRLLSALILLQEHDQTSGGNTGAAL